MVLRERPVPRASNPSLSLPTGQTGAHLAVTVNAQAQGAASASIAQCQVSLDGTTLDVQQVTVPGGTGTGEAITLVGTGTSSSSPGGGTVLVQCSDSGGTFSAINITATQVEGLN